MDSHIARESSQSSEKRRSPRRKEISKAIIFYPNQTERLDCLVWNISSDGALLEFPSPVRLPKAFWLRLDGHTRLSLCTVVWGSEYQVGVEFSEHEPERRQADRWTELLTS